MQHPMTCKCDGRGIVPGPIGGSAIKCDGVMPDRPNDNEEKRMMERLMRERPLDYDGLMTCEKHPDKLWSEAHPNGVGLVEACEPGCAGPGMPLAESLAHLGELRQSVRYMAVDNSPYDAQGAAERLVEQWDGPDATGQPSRTPHRPRTPSKGRYPVDEEKSINTDALAYADALALVREAATAATARHKAAEGKLSPSNAYEAFLLGMIWGTKTALDVLVGQIESE